MTTQDLRELIYVVALADSKGEWRKASKIHGEPAQIFFTYDDALNALLGIQDEDIRRCFRVFACDLCCPRFVTEEVG